MHFVRSLVAMTSVTVAGVVSTAAGQTYAPLNTITPGTEVTTGNVVPNGTFETFTGTKPTAEPTSWGKIAGSDMFVANPTAAFASNGASAVVAFDDESNGFDGVTVYAQTVGVLPNTDYVLSAYIWNFGSAGNGFNANVDLNDIITTNPTDGAGIQLTLTPGAAGASGGVFAYSTFNTLSNFSLNVRVFYDALNGVPGAGARAQWDNIAITPAANFVAPVPEPATGALLALGGGAGLLAGRRRRR